MKTAFPLLLIIGVLLPFASRAVATDVAVSGTLQAYDLSRAPNTDTGMPTTTTTAVYAENTVSTGVTTYVGGEGTGTSYRNVATYLGFKLPALRGPLVSAVLTLNKTAGSSGACTVQLYAFAPGVSPRSLKADAGTISPAHFFSHSTDTDNRPNVRLVNASFATNSTTNGAVTANLAALFDPGGALADFYDTNGDPVPADGMIWFRLNAASFASGGNRVTFTTKVGDANAPTLTFAYEFVPLASYLPNPVAWATADAADTRVTVGKTLTLTASATGNPAPAYQWQVSTDGGATWTDIENAAASSCTIDPVTADMNGWHYRYSATNHAGSQTSNAATITVRPAWFDTPSAIVVDQAGNIYVTDAAAHVIRSITNDGRVDVFTGQLSTPGTATGAKTSTRLNTPSGLSIAPNKTLRFTDRTQRVRIANESGATDVFVGSTNNTGLVDGYRTSARFNNPSAIVTDSKGTSYVADSGNHAIRRISVDSALGGNVVTIAGAGAAGAVDATTGTLASFDSPSGLVLDEIAQLLYVADTGNHVIRVIDLANSNYPVTLHAGQFGVTGASDGEGLTEALFNSPHGLALDGGDLYVADTDNSTIRHIQANGRVSTVAGSAGSHGFADGPGADATFNHPVAVAVDASGNLYVLDTGNAALRKIAPDGTVSSPALTDYWIPEPPPASSTNGGGATTVWFALAPAVLIAIRMRKQ